MPDELTRLARDFDEIAEAMRHNGAPEELTAPERALLEHVPHGAHWAIDVGCGAGQLSRALGHRGVSVLGVDLSARMIELARTRTPAGLPVKYKQADVMLMTLPQRSFDVVVSTTMVHHLPFSAIVRRLAELVAPGGTLLVQDIVERSGLADLPINLLAYTRVLARRVTGRERNAPQVRALYEAHGRRETYFRPSDVASAYRKVLGPVRVLHHLDWRYTVIWRRQ